MPVGGCLNYLCKMGKNYAILDFFKSHYLDQIKSFENKIKKVLPKHILSGGFTQFVRWLPHPPPGLYACFEGWLIHPPQPGHTA